MVVVELKILPIEYVHLWEISKMIHSNSQRFCQSEQVTVLQRKLSRLTGLLPKYLLRSTGQKLSGDTLLLDLATWQGSNDEIFQLHLSAIADPPQRTLDL